MALTASPVAGASFSQDQPQQAPPSPPLIPQTTVNNESQQNPTIAPPASGNLQDQTSSFMGQDGGATPAIGPTSEVSADDMEFGEDDQIEDPRTAAYAGNFQHRVFVGSHLLYTDPFAADRIEYVGSTAYLTLKGTRYPSRSIRITGSAVTVEGRIDSMSFGWIDLFTRTVTGLQVEFYEGVPDGRTPPLVRSIRFLSSGQVIKDNSGNEVVFYYDREGNPATEDQADVDILPDRFFPAFDLPGGTYDRANETWNFTTRERQAVEIFRGPVTAGGIGDTQTYSYEIEEFPANGDIEIIDESYRSALPSIRYRPYADFSGEDRVTIKIVVQDRLGRSLERIIRIKITVTPAQPPPPVVQPAAEPPAAQNPPASTPLVSTPSPTPEQVQQIQQLQQTGQTMLDWFRNLFLRFNENPSPSTVVPSPVNNAPLPLPPQPDGGPLAGIAQPPDLSWIGIDQATGNLGYYLPADAFYAYYRAAWTLFELKAQRDWLSGILNRIENYRALAIQRDLMRRLCNNLGIDPDRNIPDQVRRIREHFLPVLDRAILERLNYLNQIEERRPDIAHSLQNMRNHIRNYYRRHHLDDPDVFRDREVIWEWLVNRFIRTQMAAASLGSPSTPGSNEIVQATPETLTEGTGLAQAGPSTGTTVVAGTGVGGLAQTALTSYLAGYVAGNHEAAGTASLDSHQIGQVDFVMGPQVEEIPQITLFNMQEPPSPVQPAAPQVVLPLVAVSVPALSSVNEELPLSLAQLAQMPSTVISHKAITPAGAAGSLVEEKLLTNLNRLTEVNEGLRNLQYAMAVLQAEITSSSAGNVQDYLARYHTLRMHRAALRDRYQEIQGRVAAQAASEARLRPAPYLRDPLHNLLRENLTRQNTVNELLGAYAFTNHLLDSNDTLPNILRRLRRRHAMAAG